MNGCVSISSFASLVGIPIGITSSAIGLNNFAARLKQANLASKRDIANFVKKTDFDNKLNIMFHQININ